MKIPSKSGGVKNEELIHLLNHLEREWETFKQGKLQNTRRSSSASASSNLLEHSFDHHLLENSPRELMYSLQRRGSPSDGFFRERNLDVAVEEVFKERRDGIVSGKIKGRRLFTEGATAVELDLNYDDNGDWLSVSGERDLPDTLSVSCLSDGSFSEEKGCLGGGGGGGGGGGCMAAMPWLVFLVILVIIGLISVRCYAKYVHENELILVPT